MVSGYSGGPMGTLGAPGPPEGEMRCPIGTRIYVPSAESVWTTASVVSVEANGVLIAKLDAEGQVVQLKKGDPFYLCNTDEWNARGLCAPEDLTSLMHLHEAAVLDSLDIRFEIDSIYTFTGQILIAVNPFKTLKGLYDYSTLKRYIHLRGFESDASRVATSGAAARGSSSEGTHGGGSRDALKEPHVFATSSAAYEGMCLNRKSQTILISGESGAGKTESTKFVMKFLACAGSDDIEKRSTVRGVKGGHAGCRKVSNTHFGL
ncbi:myosin [Cyclospora cayetanensis]|uniref:Myosin n=1 Tax=Cyclospora cayetanensis TaxID=88456 RepID=A0A1D3CUQ4_9EIME|nr:myosin [Cyclospora cayetanensis]